MITDIQRTKPIKESHQGISIIIAFALIPLSGFATDIYLPSLPAMASDLHVRNIEVQLTLTIFLISYGVSQLFIGSILDSFGRHKPGLIALIIFAVASIVIATTHNIYIIYGMRVIHGAAVAAVVVGKRAYFVDLFTGDRLKNYLSWFTIVWSTGPIVAPFIGGYFQTAFGWQSNFYFLAAFAVLLAILEYLFSGETIKYIAGFDLKKIVTVYGDMIRTSSFMLGLVMLGLSYCMVIVYNLTGPFIIEHHLHLTPVIAGYSSLILGFAWMVGGFIGKATIDRPFFKKLLVNLGLQVVFVAAMIISLGFMENVYSLLFFAFIIHVAAGYTFNNYFTYSMSKFPKHAGIASGLTGGITFVITSILSYGIVYLVPAKDAHNLSYSYLILTLLSALVMFVIFKVNQKSILLTS